MERDNFFKQLHIDIAKQYNTHPHVISFIRTCAIGQKMTTEQMLKHLRELISAKRERLQEGCPHPKYDRYIERLKFINRNRDLIKKITFKTEYDK